MLNLDSVRVEPAGYGSATREISADRTYPNLANQDTSYIPKTIEENGKTLTLQSIQWQQCGEQFTATAVYTGAATSSYVTGYTITADYVGTVSRIVLDRVRYVAIFSGAPLAPEEPKSEPAPIPEPEPELPFPWPLVLVPLRDLR